MPKVTMLEIYGVQVSVSNCTAEDLQEAGWKPDPRAPVWNKDLSWLHDEIDDALKTIRTLSRHPVMRKGAVIMFDVRTMTEKEYRRLPQAAPLPGEK